MLSRHWVLLAGLLAGCADGEVPPGYQGVVEHEERQVGFEVGGRVVELAVGRGDRVSSGEVVARLDDSLERPVRDARAAELEAARAQAALLHEGSRPEEIRQVEAQLRAARATVAQVELNLGRQRELASSGAAAAGATDDLEAELARARAEVDLLSQRLRVLRDGARPEEIAAADARVDAAEAALALAEQRLARYTLYAPIDGTVIDVVLRPGETAAAGVPVVLLADTAHPYVDVFVPQGELAGVMVGTRATVRVDAGGVEVSGTVEDVGREGEFTPRFLFSQQERPTIVIRVRVRLDDPDRRLHAGVPAFAVFHAGGAAP